MAPYTLGCLMLLWAQEGSLRAGQPQWVFLPEVGGKRPLVWIAVAWPHAPHQEEIGYFIANMATAKDYPGEPASHLRQWAEAIGLQVQAWSGPEGAALHGVVPRANLLSAVEWLYTALSHLPIGQPLVWEWHKRNYLRQWRGFSLERELLWRLRGRSLRPGAFSYEETALYVQRYLRPDSFRILVSGTLSLREKTQLQRKVFRQSYPVSDTIPSPPRPSPPPPDTTEENLWAYPAYVALLITTPPSWGEKVAFLQAFFTRWEKEAPPLRKAGYFLGDKEYFLQTRLDGKSYRFLRNLSYLKPQDSLELSAWQAAYKLMCARLLSFPETAPEVWIASALRGDTVLLPDTLPLRIWEQGWSFQARGLWLTHPDVEADTMTFFPATPLDTAQTPCIAPDLFWEGKGLPPLSEWASALQLYRACAPDMHCDLIAYYRRPKARDQRLKEAHALRKKLISGYGIPPQTLRVVLQKAPPDFPEKALRLRCTNAQ